MRVAVVSDLVRPNGAGLMALHGAEILGDAGIDVGVFAGAMSPELEAALGSTYGTAESFTHDEKALDGSVTGNDHRSFRRHATRWLRQALGEFAPDVLYIHNCGRILTQLDVADLSRTWAVVHTMHDEWWFTDAHYTFALPSGDIVRTYEPDRSEPIAEHRYEHLFDLEDRLGRFAAVGPSAWITERAQRVFPRMRIEHIANAVDDSLFPIQERRACRRTLGLPEDYPIALFVGSPTQERKGLAAFEAAMRHVELDGVAPMRLIAGGSNSVAFGGAEALVGPGPLRDLLDRPSPNPIGALGIVGPGLAVAGAPRRLMATVYGAADVLVHPSRIDNLPTVPIEAGLCGTRCLASDVGGTSETIADVGDLFALGISPQELGQRVQSAIAEARKETVDDRERRRSTQLDRFSRETHRAAIVPLLESTVHEGGVSSW